MITRLRHPKKTLSSLHIHQQKRQPCIPGTSFTSSHSLTWDVSLLVQGSCMSFFFKHVKGITNYLADRYALLSSVLIQYHLYSCDGRFSLQLSKLAAFLPLRALLQIFYKVLFNQGTVLMPQGLYQIKEIRLTIFFFFFLSPRAK